MIIGYNIRYGNKYHEIKESIEKSDVLTKMEFMRDLESKVNEGMSVSLESEKPEDNIYKMLEFVGEMFEADRSYLVESNPDITMLVWDEKNSSSIQNLSLDEKQYIRNIWINLLTQKKTYVIDDIEEMEKIDPNIYRYIKKGDIFRVIEVPVYDKNEVVGYFGIDNPSEKYMDVSADILDIISNFFTSSLRKKNLFKELQSRSQTDAVTGAKNRYAMISYFEKIKHQSYLSIAFCDITGLKEINDTKGHNAGDILIQNFYQSLIGCFESDHVFRIGGDEFVVICNKLSLQEFEQRILELRKALEEKGIVAAIGTEYLPYVLEDNVFMTIENAETKMYTEKSNWYRQNGRDRRAKQ